MVFEKATCEWELLLYVSVDWMTKEIIRNRTMKRCNFRHSNLLATCFFFFDCSNCFLYSTLNSNSNANSIPIVIHHQLNRIPFVFLIQLHASPCIPILIFDSTPLNSPLLWSRTFKNPDWSAGPLARPFAYSLALLALFSCSALLASLARSAALTHSLAHSLCSLPCSWESEWLDG